MKKYNKNFDIVKIIKSLPPPFPLPFPPPNSFFRKPKKNGLDSPSCGTTRRRMTAKDRENVFMFAAKRALVECSVLFKFYSANVKRK